jgi:hypothetical protein
MVGESEIRQVALALARIIGATQRFWAITRHRHGYGWGGFANARSSVLSG